MHGRYWPDDRPMYVDRNNRLPAGFHAYRGMNYLCFPTLLCLHKWWVRREWYTFDMERLASHLSVCPSCHLFWWRLGNRYSAGSGWIWLDYGLHAVETAWHTKHLLWSWRPPDPQSVETWTGHPSRDWSHTASVCLYCMWYIYCASMNLSSRLAVCRVYPMVLPKIAKTAMMHQDPQLWDTKDYWCYVPQSKYWRSMARTLCLPQRQASTISWVT